MTDIRLIALPLDEVTRADALLRCTPYACTLSASACITRQKQADTGDPRYSLCRDCRDGQQVARQVTSGVPDVRLCTHSKCARPAHEDGPLCQVHVRAQRAVVASAKAQGRTLPKKKSTPMTTSNNLDKVARKAADNALNQDMARVMIDVADIVRVEGGVELLRALAKTLRGKSA